MFDHSFYSKKNCEICKTLCVHESIFNNELNDMKRINNYLNFLNKTNGQTRTKKSNVSNILKRMEYKKAGLLIIKKYILKYSTFVIIYLF